MPTSSCIDKGVMMCTKIITILSERGTRAFALDITLLTSDEAYREIHLSDCNNFTYSSEFAN